ncbi:hypothetical protein LTR66_008659 [Elasticomyces elasticus]|nr:hypothetical protein LTR28_000407 [Elasticomyces elasticus]KAK4983942.1 hypothetical protein LTR66_008659 [Elasticomyces elasticus]
MRLSIKDLSRTPSPPSLPLVAEAKHGVLTDLVPRRQVAIKPSAVEERTAEPLSTDEYRPNLSPEPKAGRSPGPEHQPLAVHHTTTARLSASRQQIAANVQVVDQRVSNSFTSGQQTAIQPVASERANIPGGEEVVLSDSYIVSYIDNPVSIRGYAIQRSPSAPCSLPEWSSTQGLHTLDGGTEVYEDDDIVHIDLALEDQHSKFCPASLARIVDLRDLGCGDGDKGSGIIFLVACFNTRHDERRYPQHWGCKNVSAWPKGKTHVLTTRLQPVEVGAVGRLLGPKERRRLEMGKVHDVLGRGRITEMTASLQWRFREAGPQQVQ